MSIIILKETLVELSEGDKFPSSLEGISEIHFNEGIYNIGEIKPFKSLTLMGKSKKTIIQGFFDTSLLKSSDNLILHNFTVSNKGKCPFIKFDGSYQLYRNNIDIKYN